MVETATTVDPDLLARHSAWWQRKGLLVARTAHEWLSALWVPLADGTDAQEDLDLTPDLLDLERLAGPALKPGPLEREGDRVRTRAPYARVPWVEAIVGCPIRASVQGGAMRAQAFIPDLGAWPGLGDWRSSPWLEALARLTELLVARSAGRAAVTHTLMRGPVDLAEAALGPEQTALAIYDRPQALERFLDATTDLFLGVLEAQMSLVPQVEGGQVNPFGVWAPGRIVRTQCDASAILSPEQYRRWFLPYDERLSAAVDYAIIHLHSGSLHTVDVLLDVGRPQAIQVSLDPEPSGPPVGELVPIFRRILEVKPLVVDGELSEGEIDMLLGALPHDGLYISARQRPAPRAS